MIKKSLVTILVLTICISCVVFFQGCSFNHSQNEVDVENFVKKTEIVDQSNEENNEEPDEPTELNTQTTEKTFIDFLHEIEKQPLPSIEEVLGQNLLVGFDGLEITDDIRKMLTEMKPGGIVIYRRNIKTSEQLTGLIKELQEIALSTTSEEYFIMLDEEPDGASRTGLLKNCFPLGSPFWKKIDQDVEILSSLGINTELAPVTDFPFNPDSFISKRVPMKTVEELVDFNRVFIEILHQHNMFATLKHFPGMGAFTTDPHLAIPDQEISEQTFDQSVDIFREGIDSNADFVMTAHAIYNHVDKDYPATLSHTIITGILKEQLQFKGLIITDDLSDMALATNRWSLEELGELALKAGHHMILYSHKLSRTYDTFHQLTEQCKNDETLYSQVVKNYQYITAFKNYHEMNK
jgi:beta-N-acetylhexosaminidase